MFENELQCHGDRRRSENDSSVERRRRADDEEDEQRCGRSNDVSTCDTFFDVHEKISLQNNQRRHVDGRDGDRGDACNRVRRPAEQKKESCRSQVRREERPVVTRPIRLTKDGSHHERNAEECGDDKEADAVQQARAAEALGRERGPQDYRRVVRGTTDDRGSRDGAVRLRTLGPVGRDLRRCDWCRPARG